MSDPRNIPLTPAQRQAAVERIHENLALRSGAGCGKTYVLARRFTELLMADQDPAAAMSRLVALTFTDKAAMEMTQRVRKMLADFAATATSPADRRKLLEYLEQASEARISTIHGFCASLLRTHAIEAGVDPDFAVCADDLLVQRMLAEAADQAVLSAVEAGDAPAAELLTRYRYDRIVELVQGLMSDRTAVELDRYLDPAATLKRWTDLLDRHRQRIWKALEADAAFARELDELDNSTFADKSGKLVALREELVAAVRRVLRDAASRTDEMFLQIANVKPGTTGGAGEAPTECRARMKRIQARIAEVASQSGSLNPLDEQAAAALATLARLAGEGNEIYRRQKVQAGLLDFCDLLDCTARLLKSSPAVRTQLASQIDQLLIDECQDTDPFQLGMLCLLVGTAAEALPSEGRLFIVGDAKQSIYRFRGAQVEVFEDLCNRFAPSRQQHLDVSFRTHRAGVAFVNSVFSKIMPDYQPTRSNRTEQPPQASVEILLATNEPPFTSAAEASDAQAALTARRIREMIDGGEKLVFDAEANQWRPVRAGDIAILFARMTNSLEYERQLAAIDVPYYVVAGTGFFQQQEVLDLLNALRVIDSPDDDIALVGVLRSSLVGLDDNAMMHIAQSVAVGSQPYFYSLLKSLPSAMDASLAEALKIAIDLLADLHNRKDSMGPDEILRTILDATGYEAVLLASPTGKRMLGNVRLLLDQARSAAAGAMSLSEFISQMDEMVINESRYEQAAVAGEREDVVRLMTIHKAKGLEFPVVFVPDLNAARQGLRGAILNRADWGLTLKIAAAGDNGQTENGQEDDESQESKSLPAGYLVAKALEEDDQAREDIRKYYVALTRHEDHLVLVGANWRAKDGQFKGTGSFLQNLASVLDIDTPQGLTLRERSSDGQEYVCQVDVRYEPTQAQPPAVPSQRSHPPPGQLMLKSAASAEQLADALASVIAENHQRELLGPLKASPANLQVAVTSLCDFERCPMLFRWRYELGVPERFLRDTAVSAVRSTGILPVADKSSFLDAATAGTIFHRCMELLDFGAAPASGDVLKLVQRVLAEMGIQEQTDATGLAAELTEMLAKLQSHQMWKNIRAATRIDREFSFVTQASGVVLRGQIDLIYQDGGGAWHIVDYKSNRIGTEGVAPHASQYELQMMVYVLAAKGHVGTPPAEATLYFLRAGQSHTFRIAPESCEQAMGRVAKLAAELAQSRRSGNFERRKCQACAYCQYQPLCSPPET